MLAPFDLSRALGTNKSIALTAAGWDAHAGRGGRGAPAARPLSTLRSPGEEQKAAEYILRQTLRKAIGDEVEKVALLPVPGLPGRVLVETARTLTATMVMLATRREQAARLLGAVSQYVPRHAPCPVLVVPEASKGL